MKAINIIGIPASVAAFLVCGYYIGETISARWGYWSLSYEGDYGYYGPSPADVTMEGGLVTLVFTLFFVLLNIANLVKIKTVTSKVLGIIGISLNGIVVVVNLLMIGFVHDMNFDESTGPLWIFFAPIMLAFSIVFLVQSTRKTMVRKSSNDTLDDIINDIV